ncbi:MAG TPA: tripartite tricarboxylate transporter substrate binding protein [Burkholderiales bacterium]|nr:tripartite tricarboxylate transporter substrate binding protein [Burkholderiales bacterium]
MAMAIAIAAGLIGSGAIAQTPPTGQAFPTKPVRLIVPFAPGGAPDLVARGLAPKLNESLGQPVIVENRAGAGGIIGMELVARAAPDGHTLVVGSAGPLAIVPNLHRKLSYDVMRDFAPISMVTAMPFLLVVHPSLPVKPIKDLMALAKARPGELNYGSPGNGSTTHLATELLKSATGMKITHIPYKGVAEAATALVSGQVQVLSGDLNAMLPQVKAGRMRGIAVTSARRSQLLPDTPTVAESGVPGFDASGWMGVLAPAATPAPVIERLNATITKALAAPDTRNRLGALGGEVRASSPAEFAAFIRTEAAKWSKLIRSAGIEAEQL